MRASRPAFPLKAAITGIYCPQGGHHGKRGPGEAGIFTRDKRGVWACYALVPSALNALASVLTTTR
jgi:ArsR family transcriptional regulator